MSTFKVGRRFKYILNQSIATGHIADDTSWWIEVKLPTSPATYYVGREWFKSHSNIDPNTTDLTFIDWEDYEDPKEKMPIEKCWHTMVDYVGFTEKYRYCTKCDYKEFP